ncbi:hypothetical protein LINPERHAP1_LOCUS40021 [Linum perenne]
MTAANSFRSTLHRHRRIGCQSSSTFEFDLDNRNQVLKRLQNTENQSPWPRSHRSSRRRFRDRLRNITRPRRTRRLSRRHGPPETRRRLRRLVSPTPRHPRDRI